MNCTVLGWSDIQWAYAHRRYRRQGNDPLPTSMKGLVSLAAWWRERKWPEPMAQRLQGAVLRVDHEWAALAMAGVAAEFEAGR